MQNWKCKTELDFNPHGGYQAYKLTFPTISGKTASRYFENRTDAVTALETLIMLFDDVKNVNKARNQSYKMWQTVEQQPRDATARLWYDRSINSWVWELLDAKRVDEHGNPVSIKAQSMQPAGTYLEALNSLQKDDTRLQYDLLSIQIHLKS